MNFPNCTEENDNAKITIIDRGSKNNKSKVVLENPDRKKLQIIQIEDCVIPEGTEGGRCDKLIVVVPDDRLIFIELKGNDVEKAIKQLIDSINYLKEKCSDVKNKKSICIISCTRCPLSSTDVQNKKKIFKDKYKATLLIKSGKMTHQI